MFKIFIVYTSVLELEFLLKYSRVLTFTQVHKIFSIYSSNTL